MTDPEIEPVLATRNLGIRYGSTHVVEDVSLHVERGSVFALLGRNGAGKSSLLRCVLGQQRADAGQALLFGKGSWSSRAEAMARIGVVPEEPDAPPEMSASALVSFCRRLYARWDDQAVVSRLKRSELPLDVPFGKLSKGQKGALMLALALGHGPELLVLDDPTLGLDAVAKRDLYDEVIGDLADRGTTVVITSHDLEGIERLADRVAILHGRRMLLDEPKDDLKARFRRLRVASAAGNELSWAPFETLATARPEWGQEALVSNFTQERLEAFSRHAGASEPEVLPLSLEEIFMVLTKGKQADA